MKPALREPDLLCIEPCQGGRIRRGDVVVFQEPGSDIKVVHRVVSIGADGILTRGDAHRNNDPYLLKPGDLIGRVKRVRRGGRQRRMYGGFIGQLHALAGRIGVGQAIDKSVSNLLHPTYHRISHSGILRRLLSDRLTPRVFCFKRPGGAELQLLFGRFVAGRRPAGRGQWRIRRPFRLLVDETSLPQ